MTTSIPRIHQDQPALTYGAALDQAEAAVILLHGRGATAHSLLPLAEALPGGKIAYVLPAAAGNTWYPNSGFAPFATNEPYLSSALAAVGETVARLNAAGLPNAKIILGGFSQGACLASEFVARNATRYGGLIAFSGALLGPLDTPREYAGSLDGTPVFIGAVDRDPWVSAAQIRMSAEVLEKLGGAVTLRLIPGSEHTIRLEEVEAASAIIAGL